MNLVRFTQEKTNSEDELLVKDFRKADMGKLEVILIDMFSKISLIDPEYSFTFSLEVEDPGYLEKNTYFYDRVKIKQKYKEHENEISFIVPKLINDNFFNLNNMIYVPLIFLEKAPIDRIFQDGKNKIFANINAVYNFTFDFVENKVQFRSKSIEMDLFLKIFFDGDEYLDHLIENKYIKTTSYTAEEFKKFIKFFGFYKMDFFENLDKDKYPTIADWLDEVLMLQYYRDIFEDFYGVNDLKSIFKRIFYINENNIEINMADLKNRRVLMLEYLIRPVFEIYTRLVYGIIDKNNQNFLPSMNELSIMTTGFNKNLHRGNLYDFSLPFPSPMIHKISQDISIIKDGRLPKSWIENNPSGKGKLCPISVSAQNTGLALIFTSSTKLNLFGRIL